MLVPHLHFRGNCKEAIALYEKAFKTKAEKIQYDDNGNVGHAEMYIHDQRVMLNDRFGKISRTTDIAIQVVIIFENKVQLTNCYEIMKEGSVTIDEIGETFYSPCVVIFIDKFGVQWGFMVDEDI